MQRSFVDTFSFSYILCVQLKFESLVSVNKCLETSFLSSANNVWKLVCICCVALLILLNSGVRWPGIINNEDIFFIKLRTKAAFHEAYFICVNFNRVYRGASSHSIWRTSITLSPIISFPWIQIRLNFITWKTYQLFQRIKQLMFPRT